MEDMANQSQETQVETRETQAQETTQTGENTTQQVEQTLPQSIRVKYNHQEMDLPYEEAIGHIQKGMNYDKAVERAAQEARDATIAGMGWEWQGKPITTEAEYMQSLQAKELEEKIRGQYSNVPDELVNELLESRKFREESLAEKKAREESERKAQDEKDFISRRDSMYEEFLTEFPDYTDAEKQKSIPKEVWADADKWLKSGGREGRRLADALTRHNFKQSLTQQRTTQANQANADASTGSVKGDKVPNTFISKAAFEANKSDQAWVRNNLAEIEKSMKHW